MSSQTDIEALSAKVRRLEVLFETQQRESAAEPKDRVTQPPVSTGSSEPALQAEISRLQEVIAAKDAMIAAKDAIIAERDRKLSVLLESMSSHEGVLAELVRDMHRSREAVAAQNDDRHQRERTPKISVTNTDKSWNAVPTLPPTDIIGDGQTISQTAPLGLSPAKIPANTSRAPLETTKLNHFPVSRTLKPDPFVPTGPFPPVFKNAVLTGRKAGKQQASFFPWRQQQSAEINKAPKHENQKGRADQSKHDNQRPGKGSTSHGYPLNFRYPLTPRQATPKATQNSDVDFSVTTSKMQIGPAAPIHVNKDDSSGASPELVSYVVNGVRYVRDNEGDRWSTIKVKFHTKFHMPIPPEVKAAVEKGALSLPVTEDVEEVDDDTSVSSNYDPSDAASLKSVGSPAQKPEIGNFSLIDTLSPSVKKRLADEEQSGTGTLIKRLKST